MRAVSCLGGARLGLPSTRGGAERPLPPARPGPVCMLFLRPARPLTPVCTWLSTATTLPAAIAHSVLQFAADGSLQVFGLACADEPTATSE